MNRNITDEELAMLRACQSDKDWNAACDAVKAARNGAYPEDWWARVKMSGLMDEVLSRFGRSSEISVKPLNLAEYIARG